MIASSMEDEMTRAEYMNQNSITKDTFALHREYYAQFVTPAIINRVVRQIGADKIKASTDPHMNNIPLRFWDMLHPSLLRNSKSKLDDLGQWHTLATTVCVAKEAARQFKEG